MKKFLSIFAVICLIIIVFVFLLYVFRVPIANRFLSDYNLKFKSFNVAAAGFSSFSLKNIKITDLNSNDLITLSRISFNYKEKFIKIFHAEIKLKEFLDEIQLPEEKTEFNYKINILKGDIYYNGQVIKLEDFNYNNDEIITAFYYNDGRGSFELIPKLENEYEFKADYAGLLGIEGEADLNLKHARFYAEHKEYKAEIFVDYSKEINFRVLYEDYDIAGVWKENILSASSSITGKEVNLSAYLKDENIEFSGDINKDIKIYGEINLKEKYTGFSADYKKETIIGYIDFSDTLSFNAVYNDYELEGNYLKGVLNAKTAINGVPLSLTAGFKEESVEFTGRVDKDIKIKGKALLNENLIHADIFYRKEKINAEIDLSENINFTAFYKTYEIKGNYLNGLLYAQTEIQGVKIKGDAGYDAKKINFKGNINGAADLKGTADLKNKKIFCNIFYSGYEFKNTVDYSKDLVLKTHFKENSLTAVYRENKISLSGLLFSFEIYGGFTIGEKITGGLKLKDIEIYDITYYKKALNIARIQKGEYVFDDINYDLNTDKLTAASGGDVLKDIEIRGVSEFEKQTGIYFKYGGTPYNFNLIKKNNVLILNGEGLFLNYDLKINKLDFSYKDLKGVFYADIEKKRLSGGALYFLKDDTAAFEDVVINEKGVFASRMNTNFLKAEKLNYNFSNDKLSVNNADIHGFILKNAQINNLKGNPEIKFIYDKNLITARLLKNKNEYKLNLNNCKIKGIDFSSSFLNIKEENGVYSLNGKAEIFYDNIYIVKRFQGSYGPRDENLFLKTPNSDFILNSDLKKTTVNFNDFKGLNFFLSGEFKKLPGYMKLDMNNLKIKDFNITGLEISYDTKPVLLTLKEINFVGVRVEDINMKGNYENGRVIFDSLKGALFNGKFKGRANFNLKTASGALNINLENISLKNITALVPGHEGDITGIIEGVLNVLINGFNIDKIKGTGDFEAREKGGEKRLATWEFLEKIGGANMKKMAATRKRIPFISKEYIAYHNGELKFSIENGNIVFYKMGLDIDEWYLKIKIQVAPSANSIEIMWLYETLKNLSEAPPKIDVF